MKRSDEEHRIQSEAVKHARLRWPICRTNLFAIPNGGARNIVTGRRLKAEGVLPGVWDLFLAVTKQQETMSFGIRVDVTIRSGLWIEIKTPDRRRRSLGGLTVEQKEFGQNMARQGYQTAVCYSTQEILDTIEVYLEE